MSEAPEVFDRVFENEPLFDSDGKHRSLRWMIRNEPEWAESRMRHGNEIIDELNAKLDQANAEISTAKSLLEGHERGILAMGAANDGLRAENEKLHELIAAAKENVAGCYYPYDDDDPESDAQICFMACGYCGSSANESSNIEHDSDCSVGRLARALAALDNPQI